METKTITGTVANLVSGGGLMLRGSNSRFILNRRDPSRYTQDLPQPGMAISLTFAVREGRVYIVSWEATDPKAQIKAVE